MLYLNQLQRRVCLLFVVVIAVTGIMMASVLPPFTAPDESDHWLVAISRYNAAKTGDEQVCSRGVSLVNVLPPGSVVFHYAHKWQVGKYQGLEGVDRACSSTKIPYGNLLTYAPVALVQLVFESFDHSGTTALRGFFLSRYAFGAMIVLLLWRLVATATREYGPLVPGILSLVVFCMSPLFIQQSFAVSADVVVNAWAIQAATVFIAGSRVRRLDLVLLLALGLVAADTKPVIAPLALGFGLAPFFLHRRADGQDVSRLRQVAAVGLVVSLACGLFAVLSLTSKSFAGTHVPGIDPKTQMASVLANPARFLGASWAEVSRFFVHNLFTGPLGYLDTPVPFQVTQRWSTLLKTVLLADLALVVLALRARWRQAAFAGRDVAKTAAVYVGLAGMVAASFLAVCLTMYLVWTPVGADGLAGVQPRYLFPGLILSFVMLAPVGRWLAPAAAGEAPEASLLQRLTSAGVLVTLSFLALSYACMLLVAILQRFY